MGISTKLQGQIMKSIIVDSTFSIIDNPHVTVKNPSPNGY